MRPNEHRPGARSRPGVREVVLVAGSTLAALAVLASCSAGEDPAPATATSSAVLPAGASGTTSGTQVTGTAPTTVTRRPPGTAPPGTIAPGSGSSAGTAPPGTNVDRPNQSIEPDEEAPDVTWTANATDHQGDIGLLVAYDCTPDGIDATVWGSGVYTDDSSVCTAAVFEGLITIERGGRVVIQITGGRDRYDAATGNGITTLAYGSWPGSFWFPGT